MKTFRGRQRANIGFMPDPATSVQGDLAPTSKPLRGAARARAVRWTSPIIIGGAVGVLTAYGQGWLDDGLSSVANSAGPWSLSAFLVARMRRTIVGGAVAAMVTLRCCELGYALATVVRGGSNATATVIFWLAAGLLAGPPLGVAAVWSTRRGLWEAVGVAVLAGVLVGEGAYGWTTVADTTDWRYWASELITGVLLLAWTVVRGRALRRSAAAIATAATVAGVVLAAGRLA